MSTAARFTSSEAGFRSPDSFRVCACRPGGVGRVGVSVVDRAGVDAWGQLLVVVVGCRSARLSFRFIRDVFQSCFRGNSMGELTFAIAYSVAKNLEISLQW